MNPKVISETKQVFNGVAYYLCGRYFQRDGVRLHRVVWEQKNGRPVPEGFHVHHRDEDRSNNAADNLKLMEGPEHHRHHASNPNEAQRAARSRNAREHATPANRLIPVEKRAAAAKAGWEGREAVEMPCMECGKEFPTFRPTVAKFCSPACSQRDLRKRRAGSLAKGAEKGAKKY